ncbi:MAG: Ni/Fe-hydrogenase cytochrome b subunit [Anaerolineae bacterium]
MDTSPNFWQDLPMLVWLVFLRIVLPLGIVYFVGWLLWRNFAPRDAAEQHLSFFRFAFRLRKKIRPIKLPALSPGQIFGLMIVFMIWIAAAGFILARLFWGLGAATALNDLAPWGLWIGFDVMSGVALAAGGFTLAATVYVFRLERYRPILRPAILTALLGYTLVIAALMIDLGRWYNIWHPLVMWNPHSVMFEVAWCVMLYTTVLFLEFSPAIWERFHIEWARKLLHKITIPLVILGVCLSTLHQSSLGSLYLIFATKLSPFWYSPMLPIFFFTSALAVGLAMVMVEAALSAKAFHRPLENDLLASLGKPAIIVLAILLAEKIGDLVVRGMFVKLFTLSLSSTLIWLELGVGVVLPMVLFSRREWRENPTIRFRAALLVVVGVLLNRMDMAVFGFYDYTATLGQTYIPSIGEWVVTLGIVTAGVAAYALICKFFPVLPELEKHELKPVRADSAQRDLKGAQPVVAD